jgi:multidrug efflux pump subunit AcrB
VVTTIFTTFIAFAPMFFMDGLFGKFIFVIPLVISLALFISLFEVVIALPAHLMPGLKAVSHAGQGRMEWFKDIQRKFRQQLPKLLHYRGRIVLIFVIIFAGTMLFAWTQMKFVLMPSKMAEEFYVLGEVSKGTNLQNTAKHFKMIERMIDELPEGAPQMVTPVSIREKGLVKAHAHAHSPGEQQEITGGDASGNQAEKP